MAIVKCNWSGGKDSSCATHLHLTQGDKCIVCCYIPMFTKEIPLILKQHYEFILQTSERFKSMGADVHIVSGMTYIDFFRHIKTKGPYKGEITGFPPYIRGMCTFKNYSKVSALNSLDRIITYDYIDIGIAFDETDRHGQLNNTKRSILVETKRTEYDAKVYCINNGLYSPHYYKFKRDGCVLCPQKNNNHERVEWFKQYPEAFDIVLELQEMSFCKTKNHYPLRNQKLFIEENVQMGMFGDEPKWIIN